MFKIRALAILRMLPVVLETLSRAIRYVNVLIGNTDGSQDGVVVHA